MSKRSEVRQIVGPIQKSHWLQRYSGRQLTDITIPLTVELSSNFTFILLCCGQTVTPLNNTHTHKSNMTVTSVGNTPRINYVDFLTFLPAILRNCGIPWKRMAVTPKVRTGIRQNNLLTWWKHGLVLRPFKIKTPIFKNLFVEKAEYLMAFDFIWLNGNYK